MSPRSEQRNRRGSGGGRFAAIIVGASIATVVWLVVMLAVTTTPEEAREQRAAPTLPPPVAKLQATVLRQVTSYPCLRRSETQQVSAPTPPRGYQPVVTAVAPAGARVRTGTTLARVAGAPVVAVVTRAVLYRDLVVGDRGPDVDGVEQALASAGLVTRADDVLDASAVAAWRSRFDPSGPTDRISYDRIVAVPQRAQVTSVSVAVGQRIRPGLTLLEVGRRSATFRCDVGQGTAELRPGRATLRVAGKAAAVGSVVVDGGHEGWVDVTPRGVVDGSEGRLAIESSASRGVVLAAPLGALRVAADGETSVVVVDGSSLREVPVETGVTAQGLIEVAGDGLVAGADVRLFDPSGPGAGDGK